MAEIRKLTKEFLFQEYSEKGTSIKDIAAMCGYSIHNVKKRLSDWKIKRGKIIKKIPWDKGLSKDSDERLKRMSENRMGENNPMYGRDVWNKGLTKETDERLVQMGIKTSKRVVKDSTRQKQREAKLGKRGSETNHFKSGVTEMANGYLFNNVIDDYVHRAVASSVLGRELRRAENVHHIDGDRKNNDKSNLLVLSASVHGKLHKAIDFGRCDWTRSGQIEYLSANDLPFESLV